MDFGQIRKKYDKGKELSNIQKRFNGLIQEAKELLQTMEYAKTEIEEDKDFSTDDKSKLDAMISQMKGQIVL